MALEPYALVTLAEVKAYLDVTDDDRDGELERAINDVSRTVLDETGRDYKPDPADDDDDPVERTVQYRCGARYIDLAPYEAREVTAVTIDPDGDAANELDAADWQLRPIASTNGVRDRIHLRTPWYASSWEIVPVTVTGRWGWPAVPENVKGWVLEMIEDHWREDVAAYADADGSLVNPTDQSTGPLTIPFRIRDAMHAARRPRIGAA